MFNQTVTTRAEPQLASDTPVNSRWRAQEPLTSCWSSGTYWPSPWTHKTAQANEHPMCKAVTSWKSGDGQCRLKLSTRDKYKGGLANGEHHSILERAMESTSWYTQLKKKDKKEKEWTGLFLYNGEFTSANYRSIWTSTCIKWALSLIKCFWILSPTHTWCLIGPVS